MNVVLGDGEGGHVTVKLKHLNSHRAAVPALPVSQRHIYVELLQYDDLGPRLLSSHFAAICNIKTTPTLVLLLCRVINVRACATVRVETYRWFHSGLRSAVFPISC